MRMLKICLICIFIIFVAVLPTAYSMEINYAITPDIENQTVHVEMDITNISEKELILRIGAEPVNLTLKDSNGNYLPFIQRQIQAGGTEVVEIHIQFSDEVRGKIDKIDEIKIEYYAKPTPNTRFFSEKWGYVGKDFGISLEPVLLLMPDKPTKSTITFNLPEGWIGVMAREKMDENSYLAYISTPYRTAHGETRFIAFGPFNLTEREFDGHKLVMAIHKDIEFQKELEENTLKLAEYFQNVIGDYQPEILVSIVLPAQARKIEGVGTGKVGPGMGEYASFFETVPSNKREFVDFPDIMIDFPLHVPTTWFAEFECNKENAFSWLCNPWRFYYQGRAMMDVFNWSEERYKQELYMTWMTYEEANKGEEKMSIYKDSVLNNEKKIPLFGYTLNEEIKRVTSGRKDIDDVFHYLYENFALKGKEVDSKTFLQVINEITGHDFTDFFNRYFYGTEKFPIVIEFEEKGVKMEKMQETCKGYCGDGLCERDRSGNICPFDVNCQDCISTPKSAQGTPESTHMATQHTRSSPGFEVIFAVAGVVIAYFINRRE